MAAPGEPPPHRNRRGASVGRRDASAHRAQHRGRSVSRRHPVRVSDHGSLSFSVAGAGRPRPGLMCPCGVCRDVRDDARRRIESRKARGWKAEMIAPTTASPGPDRLEFPLRRLWTVAPRPDWRARQRTCSASFGLQRPAAAGVPGRAHPSGRVRVFRWTMPVVHPAGMWFRSDVPAQPAADGGRRAAGCGTTREEAPDEQTGPLRAGCRLSAAHGPV